MTANDRPDRSAIDGIDEAFLERIETVLEQVVARPRLERASTLDALCAGDAALRAEVAARVDALEQPSILDRQVRRYLGLLRAPQGTWTEPALEIGPNDSIGPYRIERILGHGGTGTVYLGIHGSLDQHVAIKLIRSGRSSPGVVERFQREQKILASLQHPNIARFLSATADGHSRACLVMEYVDGIPITEYCDAHHLDVDKRLHLFLSVLHAVEHAHTKLVVHRDIKPSNILVTPDGEVKLLDFGIAKLLSDIDSHVTRTGDVVGTLLYAAPEQLGARPAGTEAEVYSLGVVVYELLTGRLPLDLADCNPLDWPRIVAEQDPLQPSAVTEDVPGETRRSGDVFAVAAARRTSPARLSRKLAGDLDTIVMRALAKEPERRYPSAAAFRNDIEHYLAHRPVAARPDTRTYRVRKFVRRNRTGVVVAAVFALLLVSGVSAIASQAQARSREAERASGLLRILIESFRLSDPDLADGANMTVREALNKAATQVRMELADQPALMAELQLVIGSIYRDLGLHGAAEPLVEEAMRTRFASFGMDHVAAAEAMHARGWLYYLASDFGSAEELLRRALTVQRAALGESDTVVARTQDNLAEVLRATGRLDDALVLAQQVLDKRRRLLGHHADVAQSLNNVGVMQRQLGAVDDAEASFREALLIYDSLERTTDRDVLSSRSNLGMVLRARGQREEAAGLFSSVAEVQERRYGRTHPATITTVNNLGSVLAELGRVTEADSVLRDVLERWRERGEPDHLNAMTTRGNLADLMNRSQRYEEAESLQREVLTAFRSEFGENSVNTAIAANNLASTLVSRGRPTEAVSLYNGALAILDGRLAPEHSTVAIVRAGLGHALQQLDRCEEAEPLLRHAYSTLTANPGTRARAGTAGIDLGSCLMGLGRTDEAEQPLLEALDLVSSAPTERSRVLEAIVDLYEARGDTAEARRYHLMLNRVP